MKTAEEWLNDFSVTDSTYRQKGETIFNWEARRLKMVQLDAWKQGMTDAAGEIVTDGNPDSARTRIITVRDSLTSL